MLIEPEDEWVLEGRTLRKSLSVVAIGQASSAQITGFAGRPGLED